MEDVSPECCRRSFGASIMDTAKRLLEDPTIAPRAISKQRLEICEACEQYMPETAQCSLCLCFMKLKTAMANAACPLELWAEWKNGD